MFKDKNGNIQLFNREVLPEFYIDKDYEGHLEAFLGALSELLQTVEDKTNLLEIIHDLDEVPNEYLDYTAESLGWELKSETEAGRRLEASNIIEFYRLKGTLLGIKILTSPILKEYFQQISPVEDLDFAWQFRGRNFYFNGVRARLGVPDDDSLNLQPPFTIQFWFKIDVARRAWLLGKGTRDRKQGYHCYIEPFMTPARLRFTLGDGEQDYMLEAQPVGFGVWYKVQIKCDEHQCTLLLNDTVRDKLDFSDAGFAGKISYPDESDLWFGSRSGRDRLYKGWLDEIKFYNSTKLTKANLVGFWRFNQNV